MTQEKRKGQAIQVRRYRDGRKDHSASEVCRKLSLKEAVPTP